MNIFSIVFRSFLNFCLMLCYCLIAVIAGNFIYGFVLKFILGESVPGVENPVHVKLACLMSIFAFLITILFRKTFYLAIKKKTENKIDVIDIDVEI